MSNEADPKTPATVSQKLYRSLTRGPAVEESVESTSKPAAALDDVRVRQSIDLLKQAFGRTRSGYARSAELEEKVTNSAREGLKKLATEDPSAELSTAERLGIEAVIHADGSRPVFLFAMEMSTERASRLGNGAMPWILA